MYKKIKYFLNNQNIKFEHNISMSSRSYFKSGGKVNFLIYPNTEDQLRAILQMINFNKISYHIVGATSNVLFKDEINYDIIIKTTKLNGISIDKSKKIIKAESGAAMPMLAQEALKFNFGGFEGLAGIPGTVAGGIVMNAGAYGNEISDLLIDVRVLNKQGEPKTKLKDELQFSYRHSLFQKKEMGIIVSARFRGVEKIPEMIKIVINRNRNNRLTFQESTHPNIGSLFITKDIYTDLAKFDPKYKKKLNLIRKFYSRMNIEPKNNNIINYITCKHFSINYKNRVFSDKTMNCLVNKNIPTNHHLEYIKKIQKITKNTLRLENIII